MWSICISVRESPGPGQNLEQPLRGTEWEEAPFDRSCDQDAGEAENPVCRKETSREEGEGSCAHCLSAELPQHGVWSGEISC